MLNPAHPKQWKSYDDQLNLLISRGMSVADRDKAIRYLEKIGYYRLSGYWYPFRYSGKCIVLDKNFKKPQKLKEIVQYNDQFITGASFQNAVDLYIFDKKLRLLTMDALERIEVALRADIAHTLGEKDRFAYLNPNHFHNTFSVELDKRKCLTRHHEWLSKQARLIGRSKEEFIKHNREKYGFPIPIWVTCEVWDFGAMSNLYDGLIEADQDKISSKYGVNSGRVFATWLRSLNYLRNVCAHHCRLWNSNIIDQPKLPSNDEVASLLPFKGQDRLIARPFLLMCIIQHLLIRINPSSTWWSKFGKLLNEDFPDLSHLNLSLDSMGVDANWKNRFPV